MQQQLFNAELVLATIEALQLRINSAKQQLIHQIEPLKHLLVFSEFNVEFCFGNLF
jgi:hypothetical protein